MWVYSHTSSSIWCVSVLGKCFIQMAYSRLSQQWAPGVAFSPYQARSARLWFDICVFVRVYVCACVCVFASMCPIFVSCLLDSPQTRLTDIIYMHTESFSKHTHTCTQTARQMDLADTQTEMWTSCFSVWMLSQTASHNYTCPCLFDCSRDRVLCTHWAVGCRAMMCDSGGATLKGCVFMLPLKTHCKFE